MSAKAKKELTPKQKKIQTALNWIINIFCILIIIFALVLSVVTISQTTNTDNLPHLGKNYFLAVKTDSMSGTFEVGDMIIAKQVSEEDAKSLEVGQVITFRVNYISGKTIINTHRIIERLTSENGSVLYRTQGDHEAVADSYQVSTRDIIATWGTPGSQADKGSYGKILKGVGKINNWLYEDGSLSSSGKSTRYFLVIVLPLILLFVGYGFVMVYSLVKNKIAKTAEVAVNDLSEEDKERIAREYLASQGVDTGASDVDQVEQADEGETQTEKVAEETVTEEAPVEESAEDVAVDEPAEEVSEDKKED